MRWLSERYSDGCDGGGRAGSGGGGGGCVVVVAVVVTALVRVVVVIVVGAVINILSCGHMEILFDKIRYRAPILSHHFLKQHHITAVTLKIDFMCGPRKIIKIVVQC